MFDRFSVDLLMWLQIAVNTADICRLNKYLLCTCVLYLLTKMKWKCTDALRFIFLPNNLGCYLYVLSMYLYTVPNIMDVNKTYGRDFCLSPVDKTWSQVKELDVAAKRGYFPL